MSDTETPTSGASDGAPALARGRSDAVTRVLVALGPDAASGAVDPDRLREALESEGRSLVDLPEVGLWLALTAMPTTEDAHAPENGSTTRPPEIVEVIEDVAVAPGDDSPEPVIDLRDAGTGGDGATPFPPPPLAELAEPPAVPESPAALIEPPAPPPAPDPVRIQRARRLAGFLRTALGDAGLRRTVLTELDPGRGTSPDAAPVARAEAPPPTPDEILGDLDRLTSELAGTPVPGRIRIPDPGAPGTARPAPYWSRPLLRRLSELDGHLRHTLAEPSAIVWPDPTSTHGATPGPHWPIPLVRRLDALTATLRREIGQVASGAPAPARTREIACGTARPAPYWPRHLVRDATVAPGRPPRSPLELESALASDLEAVVLVGDIEIETRVAEIEVALGALLRRQSLDELASTVPASLAAFLVHHASLRSEDDPDPIPLRALRRGPAVGAAFSLAIARLGKPDFAEIERLDWFDHRENERAELRMRLHAGVRGTTVGPVLAEVIESFRGGAVSGREVAQDWLAARGPVRDALGVAPYRLLTGTRHGRLMLDAFLDLARTVALDGPAAAGHAFPPLGAATLTQARLLLEASDDLAPGPPTRTRPLVRLGADPESGPDLEVPASGDRWHLNGELLGYGSPTHVKTLPVPPSRRGTWTFSTGSSSRRDATDIGMRSATADRLVLVFDEHGRHVDPGLPLGGAEATVIAPAGDTVSGEIERIPLIGRWAGHDRIEVALDGLFRVQVTGRGRRRVTIDVERGLGSRLMVTEEGVSQGHPIVTVAPRVAFSGHVPPARDVTVRISGTASVLSDLWVTDDMGAFGLQHMFEALPPGPVRVTLERAGVPPDRHDLVWAPDEASHRWALDPVAAATDDVWPVLPATDPDVITRWTRFAGWEPPCRPDAAAALALLVGEVGAAFGGGLVPSGDWLPPLAGVAWSTGRTLDGDALADWHHLHRRPVWQWTSRCNAITNLAPLWALAPGRADADALLTLVAAGLLAELGGRRSSAARALVDDAAEVAPTLARSARVFAIAYAHTQRTHPSSRFAHLRPHQD